MKICSSSSEAGTSFSSRWRRIVVSCVYVALVAGFVGCSKRDGVQPSPTNSTTTQADLNSIQSMTALRRVLPLGLGTNEVISAFGEPQSKETHEKGQLWSYRLPAFPADNEMVGTYVTGVTIVFTNGRLSQWGCSYLEIESNRGSNPEQVLADGRVSGVPCLLEFYIIRNVSNGGDRFLNTPRFPKMGFISRAPDFAIKKLKYVSLSEKIAADRLSTNWMFRIELIEEDKAGLASFTATNVSASVLIMIGNEPVSAPRILGSLEGGIFAFDCPDRPQVELVKTYFSRRN